MATGFLKFDHDHTVYIDLDLATDEVKKAVIIDADDVETPICGGGASDFSTVQVTLKNGDIGGVFVGIPYISITGADFTVDDLTGGLSIPPNSEVILTAILYQGKLTIPENHFLVNRDESTGEYEENVSDGYITITGECSITLAPTVS